MKHNFLWVFMLAVSTLAAQITSNHLIVDTGGTRAPSSKNAVQPTGVSSVKDTANNQPDIYILGNGGFKNLFSGEGTDNSPLTGSIAVSFLTEKSETVIGFTINSIKVIDVGTNELFGANMLTPDLGGLSFSLNHLRGIGDNFGVNGVLLLASSKWQLDTNYAVQANPLVFKLSGVYAPWGLKPSPRSIRGGNIITAYFTAGCSFRALTGNISNDTIRESYFGTSKRFFGGLEFGANLVINHTTVFVNIPILFSKSKVDNLTGMQVVIGVTVGGDVLKFKGD